MNIYTVNYVVDGWENRNAEVDALNPQLAADHVRYGASGDVEILSVSLKLE